MKDIARFVGQYARKPRELGAFAPSSKYLARSMVEWIDWPNVRYVAEFGPGTGAFTGTIIDSLAPGAKFFAIELNPQFAKVVRERYPQADIVEDSVTNVAQHCRDRGIEALDAVLCGLPWASFSESLQDALLDAMLSVLRPGGQFVTFAYPMGLALPSGRRFRRKLSERFVTVEKSPTTIRNLPPAFNYRCRLAG